MLQGVVGFKENAGTRAAVANGVRILLPVRDRMDQSCFRCNVEDLSCLFLCDPAAHAIVHQVTGQVLEVQTDICGVLAFGEFGIHALSLPAGTVGHGDEILGFDNAQHILYKGRSCGDHRLSG